MNSTSKNATSSNPSKAAEAAPPRVSWAARLRSAEEANGYVAILLAVIAFILLVHFIRWAAVILVPITFAWLLSTLFFPVVQFAKRFHVPLILSAGVVVGAMVGAFALLIILLSEPAAQWVRELPGVLQQLRYKIVAMEGALSNLQDVTREMDRLADLDGNNASDAIEVKIDSGNSVERFLAGMIPTLATYGVIGIFLTFFLMASGNSQLRRITKFGRTWGARRRIVHTVHRIRTGVAYYLGTISIINFGLGCVVAVAMYFLDVPNPLLWGLMAGTLNFATYVGPAITTVVLTLVGISTFDGLMEALAVPAVFLVITTLEGQLITPMIVGRRLALSPATVFISVVVWGWLWGVAGALMAVPIVASLKIISENIPALEGVARVIERD